MVAWQDEHCSQIPAGTSTRLGDGEFGEVPELVRVFDRVSAGAERGPGPDFYETSPQVASGDLRVPVGRQVELRMQSRDVIHDFYVPEFRVKMDVVPGITTQLVFNPDKVGTYQIICAELCGVGHGVMRARIEVLPEADFETWRAGAEREVRQQISGDLSADPAAPTG